MTNFYQGLHRGPIDHEASSVINVIANAAIDMGACVALVAAPSTELLPRVTPSTAITSGYGIAVGGDTDGIYGDGSNSTDDSTRATSAAGEAVVVVTQGRCPAKVNGDINIGDKLGPSANGDLIVVATTAQALAIALQATGGVGDHIIAVDVQREGVTA